MTASVVPSAFLDILLHPERWRVIHRTSVAETGESRRATRARRQWSAENAHAHGQYEYMLCLKGQDFFGFGGTLYRAEPGTLFLLAPGIGHDNFYPDTACGLEHLWMGFMGGHAFASWILIEQGAVRRRFEPTSLLLESELGVTISAFLERPGDDPEMAAARLRILLGIVTLRLAERLTHLSADAPPAPRPIHVDVVEAIRRHIDATAGRDISLDSLSCFSGYSKFHLMRLFRRHVGCTIHGYVDRARAARMLVLSREGKTNARMAEELGFSSATAFLRWRRNARKA